MRAYLVPALLCIVALQELRCLEIPLLVRRQKSIALLTLNTTNNAVSSASSVVSGVEESFPVLIAVHIRENLMAYMESWSRSSYDSMRLISLNGSSIPAYVYRSGGAIEETVTSLAVDWITSSLYVGVETVSVHNAGRVEVCPLDGHSTCAIVLHSSHGFGTARVDALHSLVLDPVGGYMYWLNRLYKRIERAWMDGRHHDPHPFKDDTTDVIMATALTLEQETGSLYYARTKISTDDSQIWSCKLYERESCRPVASRINAFYLGVFEGFLIWTSVTNQNSGITICEKLNCEGTMRKIANSSGVETLHVIDQRIQPGRKFPNPCSSHNGGCSHVCVLIPWAPWRSCLCPIGVRLLEDRLTCAPNGIDRALLVASATGLIYISLDTKDLTPMSLSATGSIALSSKIIHVDYDPVEKKLYFIDADSEVIRRCKFDGSELEDFVTDAVTSKSEALVVDWLNRNLYWIDGGSSPQIKMQSLAGSYRQTVISRGLKQPRGLAVDPVNGFLYFSDWHESMNRIDRSWLDGSHRQLFIAMEKDAWPNGIALDVPKNRIYWAEGKRSLIMSAALNDGSDAKIISDKVAHPYSISKLGNNLYCNTLYERRLSVIRIPSGNETRQEVKLGVISDSVIFGQLGIRAVSLNHIPEGTSPCQSNNGGCSHICVKLPNGKRNCVCPVGFELLADNATCIMPAAFLVYTQSFSTNGIMRISLEKTPANKRRINIDTGTCNPSSIDIDQNRQRIFWASEGRGRSSRTTLRSAFFNGSGVENIIEGESMSYISVDWITGNIYWCNTEERRIEMARQDGLIRRTLAWENVLPKHLVVHPVQRFFVFVNFYNPDRTAIHKSPLVGERSGGPVLIPDVVGITSLTIDFESELLVWSYNVNEKGGLYVADFNGNNRVRLIENDHLSPLSLTVYNRHIFYANTKTNAIETYDGSVVRQLHSNVPNVTNLVIAHGQNVKGWNGCAGNHGCGGLCVPITAPSGISDITCLCEDHYMLDQTSGKCIPPKQFLLVATSWRFLRFNLKRVFGGDISWKDEAYATLSISEVGSPSSVGFDFFSPNRFIYWIDSDDDKVIKRATDLALSNTQSISLSRHSGCSILFALAVDDIGRQLFVSCAEYDLSHASSIHVWRIKKDDTLSYIGVVVSGRERSLVTDQPPYPRQIALFPRLNLLFYVDVSGPSPKIVRCGLDGRHCVLWESKNLVHSVRMHANQATDRLYYTTINGVWSRDAHVHTDIRHHLKTSPLDIDMVPISDNKMVIAAKGNPAQNEDVLLELKEQENSPTILLDDLKVNLSSLLVLRRILTLTVVGSNGLEFYGSFNQTCANSDCSHLCRVPLESRKQQYDCLCPLGYGLRTTNGNACFKHVTCSSWQFKCDDGWQCIHFMSKCNGHEDCVDGSDESPKWCRNVAADSWPCDDGKASIKRFLVCSGVKDCKDGSDEMHCRCKNPFEKFDCTGEHPVASDFDQCINRDLLCNEENDCSDGSDESSQLCSLAVRTTRAPSLSPSFELMIPLTVFFLLLCIVISACCCHLSRRSFIAQSSAAPLPLNAGTETRVLLPAHPDGTQVEFQVRTYSVATSSSLYKALPPPNSQISSSEANYQRSHLTGRSTGSSEPHLQTSLTAQKFYAPPPSAASLSTYGVVKPAGMKVRVESRQAGTSSRRSRRRTRMRDRRINDTHTPPPSYSQVVTSRPVAVDMEQCSERDGRLAPTNSRIVSSVDSSSPVEVLDRTRRIHQVYPSSSSDVSLE